MSIELFFKAEAATVEGIVVVGWYDGAASGFGVLNEPSVNAAGNVTVHGLFYSQVGADWFLNVLATGAAAAPTVLPDADALDQAVIELPSAETYLFADADSEIVDFFDDGTLYRRWSWPALATPPIFEDNDLGSVQVLLAQVYNCACTDERPDRTLAELRTSLLRRLGYSAQALNPPPGMAELLDDFLRDAQLQLHRAYASLRTERFFKWRMTPGTRFYGVRANNDLCDLRLDPYKITYVGIEDTNLTWLPLVAGISPLLYTGAAQQGMPCRYEVRQCIEVFPAPDRAYTLWVKGHFGVTAFSADSDQTTIDSEAVFLLALANAKAHYRQPDAPNYFGQAASYIGALVAGAHQTRRYVPRAAPAAPMVRPRMVSFDDE
jgi:hypothetical protein